MMTMEQKRKVAEDMREAEHYSKHGSVNGQAPRNFDAVMMNTDKMTDHYAGKE